MVEAAFTAAAAVSSESALDASSAAKSAAESAFETVAEAAAACKTPLLSSGTLATRRKLKCGSLRLNVSLEVDDYDAKLDGADDLAGRRGIPGAADEHFSFETVSQAMAAAVTTATSPTIAWSLCGRQFRKSSSASSAPLSVADGSATPANDAASRHAEFSAAAAALLAAAAFPRAASAGAAFTKPPRSPLASLTIISPSSPPLGAQQLSPDAARHADDPRGTTTSHKPRRRSKQNRHDHPAAEPAARRQAAAPQAAARQLAELARGGLLSPAILTSHFASTGAGLRRSGTAAAAAAAAALQEAARPGPLFLAGDPQ
ncbi:unnamed protein product [Closterium sp. NIES-64]|nr:unnamed protein product [Closterium sp. NIES-64]